MTNRIVKQRDLMQRWRPRQLCHVIQQKLEVVKKHSDWWKVNWNGDDDYSLFEVSRDIDKYRVNLKERACACRR